MSNRTTMLALSGILLICAFLMLTGMRSKSNEPNDRSTMTRYVQSHTGHSTERPQETTVIRETPYASAPSGTTAVVDVMKTVEPTAESEEKTKATVSDEPIINPPMEKHITKSGGVFWGPSGYETYYNLKMDKVVQIMRDLGYSEEEYEYWIRDDGAKMFGPYVMVAANLELRPKGTILECSLGTAIVVDTGAFAKNNPEQLDIAVNW